MWVDNGDRWASRAAVAGAGGGSGVCRGVVAAGVSHAGEARKRQRGEAETRRSLRLTRGWMCGCRWMAGRLVWPGRSAGW